MATTAPTTDITAAGTISESGAFELVLVLAVAIVAIGLVIALNRRVLGQNDGDSSIVRSWIAMSLVIGLLFFVAVAFAIDNRDVSSLLIGALAANAGAAIAFYFSSKTADQARRDVLDATFGLEAVPDLLRVCVSDARTLLGTTSFRLSLDGTPGDDWVIQTQQPSASTSARRGTAITVTTAPPRSGGGDGEPEPVPAQRPAPAAAQPVAVASTGTDDQQPPSGGEPQGG